jgi:hypothetical protein
MLGFLSRIIRPIQSFFKGVLVDLEDTWDYYDQPRKPISKSKQRPNLDKRNNHVDIHEEILRRQKRAVSTGAVRHTRELYFGKIEHFPTWIKDDENRARVPKLITSASEKRENRSKKVTDIVLKEKKFSFKFSEREVGFPDGASSVYGLLELFVNEDKVLAFEVVKHDLDESEWEPSSSRGFDDIKAFIPGDWVADLEELRAAKECYEPNHAKRNEKRESEIQEIKKNFGL